MKSYHYMLLQILIHTHNLHCFKTCDKVSMLKCAISLNVKIFSLMPVKYAETTKQATEFFLKNHLNQWCEIRGETDCFLTSGWWGVFKKSVWKHYLCNSIKRLVHPKMKISSCFTHPQGILGVYDFLLSDESNRSNIQNCPGSSKLSGVSVTQSKTCKIKCANPLKKHNSHGSVVWK